MTRGKHGVLAASRKTQAEYESEIEGFRRQMNHLQQVNGRLVDELAEERVKHLTATRKLRAQITEGVSDELEAALLVIDELRDELGRLRNGVKKLISGWDKWQRNGRGRI